VSEHYPECDLGRPCTHNVAHDEDKIDYGNRTKIYCVHCGGECVCDRLRQAEQRLLGEALILATPEFTTEIITVTGYDYRDEEGDTRGAHGFHFRFILRGPLGGITWDLNTSWVEHPIDDQTWSIYAKRKPNRRSSPGFDVTNYAHQPTGGPVASHSPFEREGRNGPYDCDVIGGQCYGDTGYLIGNDVFRELVRGGEDAVFTLLREIHDDWLGVDE
jgi:hypothetical protein